MPDHDQRFDVIVVGGGPAGSLTAYRLARAGVRVLVIDADRFPREKPCGGGIQRRASRKIPLEWTAAVREELQEVSFSFGLGGGFTRRHAGTLVTSVLRAEFDGLLLSQAEASGAVIWQDCRAFEVVASDERDPCLCVKSSKGEVRGWFVVAADGANSRIARQLNPRTAYYWQVALYSEVPTEHIQPESITHSRMRIDWGTLPSGYGWIFPKGDSVNVGVGGPASIGRSLRPYLHRFLETERLVRAGALPNLRFRGHQLPTLTSRTRLSHSNLLLVGDAAGLVEPLTGEGISNACHSAEIASDFILEVLSGAVSRLGSYDERIRREIGKEIERARQLLSLAVAFPRSLFRLLRENEFVWNAFCRVLRGEDSFLDLRRAILGRFGPLWAPLRRFAEWYENRKLHSYGRSLAEGDWSADSEPLVY
jgi:geranylgeranyl reductase family protein